jgi:hypothetical protein
MKRIEMASIGPEFIASQATSPLPQLQRLHHLYLRDLRPEGTVLVFEN